MSKIVESSCRELTLTFALNKFDHNEIVAELTWMCVRAPTIEHELYQNTKSSKVFSLSRRNFIFLTLLFFFVVAVVIGMSHGKCWMTLSVAVGGCARVWRYPFVINNLINGEHQSKMNDRETCRDATMRKSPTQYRHTHTWMKTAPMANNECAVTLGVRIYFTLSWIV